MMSDNPYFVPGAPENIKDDHIVRAEALGGKVKALAISTTAAVEALRVCHDTANPVTAALGRFVTGSLLLSENMKNPTDTQTTVIKCTGPVKGMTCVTDSSFNVKAYPVDNYAPTTYHKPGKINVAEAVGEGTLTVIRDIGLKEPYVGSVELISGEIAEDFTYYLAKSEQTPSVVALGVLMADGKVKHAGGMMIQLLPGAGEEEISYLEARTSGFPDISFLMEEGFSPAQILDLFLGDPEIRYLHGAPVAFNCNCSKERMSSGLIALGRTELEGLLDDPDGIETQCHFCNKKYRFSSDEIKALIAEIG